jgi:hypothetical protein
VPVKNENDKVIGILGVFWDITEKKKAEQNLLLEKEKYKIEIEKYKNQSKQLKNKLKK